MWPQDEKGKDMVKDWNELDKEALYDWLKGVLKEGNVDLEFVKKDGSTRKMVATLKESVIPQYEKKTNREKKATIETMSVFDVELQEWRSFKLDNIKTIKFSLGES